MDFENFPKLNSVIIGTTDSLACKKFYVEVFGLKIEKESPNYISGHLVDGTRIELEEDSENRFKDWAKNNIGTYNSAQFNVRDLSKFLTTVEEYGGKIVSAPIMKPWGEIAAEFSDIDGNVFLISEKK